jgi:hypothetical protein
MKWIKSILFDSHVILRYSQDEKGADIVEGFLHKAETGSINGYMSEIKVGEVCYHRCR